MRMVSTLFLVVLSALACGGCKHSNTTTTVDPVITVQPPVVVVPEAVTPVTPPVVVVPETTPLFPEAVKKNASIAGRVAAAGYLVIQRPDKNQVAAISVALKVISEHLKGYKQNGFSSASAEISDAIAKVIGPGKEVETFLAQSLADTLLDSLDLLFARFPDWKNKGDEVAGIISSFCDGAASSLNAYVERGIEAVQRDASSVTRVISREAPRGKTKSGTSEAGEWNPPVKPKR